MKHIPIKTNFKYPDLKPENYRFGSNQFIGTPLRENGDWRDYLPPEESQNVRGIESSACYVEAQQHTIATIEEEELGEPDNNYASRFNAKLSNGTPQGGDPIAGADSIRHDGLVKDRSMPFSEDIQSWEDFNSWKGVAEKTLREEGQNYLAKKGLNFDVVVERHEPVETKYIKLKQALKYCPPPVSVVGWYEENGIYIKPKGAIDNHLVELVYIDENNRPYIRDTYPPYLKILEPYYNFDFAMRWGIKKKEIPSIKDTPMSDTSIKDAKRTSNWFVEIMANLLAFLLDIIKSVFNKK